MKTALLSLFFVLTFPFGILHSAPSPELPGEEIIGSKKDVQRSKGKVKHEKGHSRKASKWNAPPIDIQLARDKTLIGMGTGAIFIPVFTESRLEPKIQVISSKRKKAFNGKPGERIIVEAGHYKVQIGSGNESQKISYGVDVEDGRTTIIEPHWAGLIIETINKEAEYTNDVYEVYRMDRFVAYGKGFGRKEEQLKDLKTWILPAGVYKIMRSGADYTSFSDYITVQLNSGELTTVELVFEDVNNEQRLIAGGVKDLKTQKKAGTNWKYGLRFGGNIGYDTKFKNRKQDKSIFKFLTDIRLTARYDNVRYLGINEIKTKQDFNFENSDFKPVIDIFQIRSTWVRRLNNYVGPYISGKLNTQLFPEIEVADSVQNYYILKNNGDTSSVIRNQDFEYSPALSPLELGVGAGVNLELLKTAAMDVSVQVGGAARKTYVRDEFTQNSDKHTYSPIFESDDLGMETNLIARFQLLSNFTVDLQAELFSFVNGQVDEFNIEAASADFRFNITRNLNLVYQFFLEDSKEQNAPMRERLTYNHGFLFRISLNY